MLIVFLCQCQTLGQKDFKVCYGCIGFGHDNP